MNTPKILVRDHMKPLTHFFLPDTSVEKVVKTLVKNGLVGAPVLDEEKNLLGFITEQNCIKEILNDSYYDQNHLAAKDIMRKNPLFVSPDDSIIKLAEEMLQKRPKLYPVLENGKVIGIITRRDVLKALSIAKSLKTN
jgi:CBS domain-containing protein